MLVLLLMLLGSYDQNNKALAKTKEPTRYESQTLLLLTLLA